MTVAEEASVRIDPLGTLRGLRARQAITLAAVSILSIGIGIGLFFVHPVIRGADAQPFAVAVAWQFVTWGAIDLIFAVSGIAQSLRTAKVPPTPQAEVDEFLAAEKLLKALHFNQKLNWLWLAIAAALLAWAAAAHSLPLAGHGVGVLLQGGFLFVFDHIYANRFERLMTVPA